MSMYAIKDTTLTALGDAVRSKTTGIKDLTDETVNCIFSPGTLVQTRITAKYSANNRYIIDNIITDDTGANSLSIYNSAGSDESKLLYRGYIKDMIGPIEFEAGDVIFMVAFTTNINLSFDITIIPLDENGNEYKYTPLEMADTINELIVVPDEGLLFTSNQMLYNFYQGKNQWLIDQAGEKIRTQNLTSINYAFYENKVVDKVPFIINADPNYTSFTFNSAFKNSSITSLPKMYNVDVGQMTEMCSGATMLRDIPDDWCETWKWTYAHGTQSFSGGRLFQNCYSLRKLPISLCENIMNRASTSYCNFAYCFLNCHTLDEITHMGTIGDVFTLPSNVFTDHISKCYRLKDYIFKLNDDNTPQIVKWKKQVIDFSTVGYADSIGSILNYNSGITADKEVKDDATYQALKNNPDWFSCDINYSRYNHDSAVRTINSLPDTSAYLATQTGTGNNNTIKFKGSAGALTDGGAINTLTEEEIAVATAKGWTVSLV